jgi:hypothetical protein
MRNVFRLESFQAREKTPVADNAPQRVFPALPSYRQHFKLKGAAAKADESNFNSYSQFSNTWLPLKIEG